MQYTPSLHYLSNGLPVLLDPMDIATTSMTVSIKVGARDEGPGEHGITHFLEHMLHKGTPRFPTTKQILDYVPDNGGTMNAQTGGNFMRFYGRILSENFHVLADSISDRLQNSLFDPAALESEKKVVLQELHRSNDNHDNQFYWFVVERLYRGTGWAHRTLGDVETIQSFTADQVRNYLNKWLSAKNMYIGVSGKIDRDATLAMLEKMYGWIPNFDIPGRAPLVVTPTIAHHTKSDRQNIKLKLGFIDAGPWTLENRQKMLYLGMFKSILGERLFDNVREKSGLVYSIGQGSMGDETVGIDTINTECSADNIEKVVAKIAKTCFDILHQNPITDSELAREKIMCKFSDANWFESAEKRKSRLIGFYRKHGMVYDVKRDQDKEQMATVDDVMAAAVDYFAHPAFIATQGPDFDYDLKKIWEDNFK